MEEKRIDYIKSHIETDIVSQPDIVKERVAKTLLVLLKIRYTRNYFITSTNIIFELEKILKINLRGENTFFGLHEIIKSASCVFPELAGEEVNEVVEYLQRMIPEKKDTPEKYMSEKLGLTSEELYNPDAEYSERSKILMANFAMSEGGNKENFIFREVHQTIEDKRLASIVKEYYCKKGYIESERPMSSVMKFENVGEELFVNLSNYGNCIMISVYNL